MTRLYVIVAAGRLRWSQVIPRIIGYRGIPDGRYYSSTSTSIEDRKQEYDGDSVLSRQAPDGSKDAAG